MSEAPHISSQSFRRTLGTETGSNGNRSHISNYIENEPNLIIWGTDVTVNECKKEFKTFLTESKYKICEAEMDEFTLPPNDSESAESPSLYMNKFEEIMTVPDEPILSVNCAHLKEFNPVLYRQLVNYPEEVREIFNIAANEIFQDLYPEYSEQITISVRPFNIDKTLTIRGLNPGDSDKLITVSGIITRVSPLIPEMQEAFFRCTVCRFTKEVRVESGVIDEPHVCTACNGKFCFELIHNRCKYIDRQLIKLQESQEDMPTGQTPAIIALLANTDLVDKVSPGDRVNVTGIYKANYKRRVSFKRSTYLNLRPTIHVVHFRRLDAKRLHDDATKLRMSSERIDELNALASEEGLYEKLANSICPGIFEHIDVKKGVLLQLFGGTSKESTKQKNDPKLRHFRAEINILLCGDPGTSKSQMLQYVHSLVPRGQYVSGKGSSAVGLTAYITRDHDTKQLVLQTGALVMCDGGICCIDEFDKMSDATRSILHEVMEQQTLSIAKAGIVCQLNARTSVLAAANPVESEWDRSKSIIDNIKLPDTLLSRFDLVFLLLDPKSKEYDQTLAKHLISAYTKTVHKLDEGLITHDLLKDYIAYARSTIKPRLSKAAQDMLIEHYLHLRKESTVKGRINVYPRNLESLIRLSEAHAKMRLSQIVETADVDEALRLYSEAVKHSSTDPVTGRIDGSLQPCVIVSQQ